ncbi:MAG: quinone-dependent dihydroorotate dehydrogenase [Planctomycetota bacterium]
MGLYRRLIRPVLFALPPESAHQVSVHASRLAGTIPAIRRRVRESLLVDEPCLANEVAGLSMVNPIGLAAGWDKSGHALSMLPYLGFGAVEIGSISARPSIGNPRPRLFRLPDDEAIIVNYGLPNDGAERVAQRLAGMARPSRSDESFVPLGINCVATNDGPGSACSTRQIVEDYCTSVRLLAGHADYLSLNLSCPNIEKGQHLFEQPNAIRSLLRRLTEHLTINCPVFLKVPPSVDPADHDRWLAEVDEFPMVKGFVFNLPSDDRAKGQLVTPAMKWKAMPGAVSGPPVEAVINQCIAMLYRKLNPTRHAIVGAGGVGNAEQAYRKLRLGASMVQLYTALVYRGPGVVREINQGLVELLYRDGVANVCEIIGVDATSGWID